MEHTSNNTGLIRDARLCPGCSSEQNTFWGIKHSISFVCCSLCKTLFTSHHIDLKTSNQYDVYYNEKNLHVPDFIQENTIRLIETFNSYRQNNRLLDVGCGAGSILKGAKMLGWDAQGLEIAPVAVEYLRSQGFTITNTYLEKTSYPANFFDVIVISEVLEHVTEPLDFLMTVAQVVRPSGLIYVTTPHGQGLSAKILRQQWSVVSPPEHIQLFSQVGLKILLQRAGLVTTRMVVQGFNPFEVLNIWRSRFTSKPLPAFDRVSTSYQLNHALMKNSLRRSIKKYLNSTLSYMDLGDGIKVYATKL